MVFHGSKTNGIDVLSPIFFPINGCNGSQNGVGVNQSNCPTTALNYAGKDGFIYLTSIPTNNYMQISETSFLTEGQKNTFQKLFIELPEGLQHRFATDLCGKHKKNFKLEDDALEFCQQKIDLSKKLNLRIDRLQPEILFDSPDSYDVAFSHNDLVLDKVNTEKLHYILNLYCNYTATEMLSSLTPGLILEKEQGISHYLSFGNIPVLLCIPVTSLDNKEPHKHLNSIISLQKLPQFSEAFNNLNSVPDIQEIHAFNNILNEDLKLNQSVSTIQSNGSTWANIIIDITKKLVLAPIQHSVNELSGLKDNPSKKHKEPIMTDSISFRR